MKKALLYGLSVTMLLASLTACGTSQADQPDPTPTPSAVQTQPAETPTPVPTVEPTNKVGEVQPMSANEVRELTQDELIKEFEESYRIGEEFIDLGLSDEDIIDIEIIDLNARIGAMPGIKKPADLDDQYIAWRISIYPQTPSQSEVQLFTDCNQTVYAIDTVNIRASYSTTSTKLGSLTRGQSVTCTGTGINDASGWSRVQLSDGTIAYMVSSYLSTTRPVQQSQPASQQTGNNGTQQTTPPSSGTPQDSSGMFWNPYAGMAEEEKEAQIQADREATQSTVDGVTSQLH